MARDFDVILSGRPNVILASAAAAESAGSGDRLAPMLMWGPDVKPGLLTSGSTHTPGLVANTDFLPTVASLLRLKAPPGIVGRPMTSVPVAPRLSLWSWVRRVFHLGAASQAVPDVPLAELWRQMHDDWYANARQQAAFGGLPTIQALIVAVTTGLALLEARAVRHRDTLHRLAVSLPLAVLWLPMLLLLLPAVAPASLPASGVLLGVGLALPVAAAALKPRLLGALTVLPLVMLVVLVVLDLAVGTPLLRRAWMSYSVMEGARYYGIGNEYCGAVLAAALGAVLFLRRLPIWAAVIPLCALALLVGWPGCGANAGGFLGLAAGFGLAALVWWRGRLRAREIAALALLIVLIMAGALLWDMSRNAGQQTHYARALGGGPVEIALRKAALNAWLLVHSPWSLALLAAGVSLIYSGKRGALRARLPQDRRLAGAMTGLLAGSLALLLLNDSGVVAAAECLTVAWAVAALAVSAPWRSGAASAGDAYDTSATPSERASSSA